MSSVHAKPKHAVQLVGENALLGMYLPFRVHHARLERVHSAALMRQIGGLSIHRGTEAASSLCYWGYIYHTEHIIRFIFWWIFANLHYMGGLHPQVSSWEHSVTSKILAADWTKKDTVEACLPTPPFISCNVPLWHEYSAFSINRMANIRLIGYRAHDHWVWPISSQKYHYYRGSYHNKLDLRLDAY